MSFEKDIFKWASDPSKYRWVKKASKEEWMGGKILWTTLNRIPTEADSPDWTDIRLVEIKLAAYQLREKIPNPEEKSLPKLSSYFVPDLLSKDYYLELIWAGNDRDMILLSKGMVYKSYHDAILRTKAMLKFERLNDEF